MRSQAVTEGHQARGLLGGAFDPVHIGHLCGAMAVRDALGLDRVDLIPAAQSPLKGHSAVSAAHRHEMLRLAITDMPGLGIDARELDRSGPSYTVLSLEELRAEYPDQPLCLALGLDAALGLPEWHRWREVLALAGIAVMRRPGWSLPEPLPQWWRDSQSHPRDSVPTSGGWMRFVDIPPIDTAAAQIREDLINGRSVEAKVPAAVAGYIKEHELYGKNTRD